MVATSKAGFVWAKAALAVKRAKPHNVTVNLDINILIGLPSQDYYDPRHEKVLRFAQPEWLRLSRPVT
jgi:hypothetical protein